MADKDPTTAGIDYVCPSGRLQCSCCYHLLSAEQQAYQTGATHAGYGWAKNPPGQAELAAAYLQGFNDAHEHKGPFAKER